MADETSEVPPLKTHIILVTCSMEKLVEFHARVAFVANGFERRGDTSNYAVSHKHLEAVLDVARELDITVEEVIYSDEGGETYPMLVGEPGTGWRGNEPEGC